MKWTGQNFYGRFALAILCLLFSAPVSRASEVFAGSNPSNVSDKVADKVTGKITTADGEPLAGASVMIRGTKSAPRLTLTETTVSPHREKGSLMCLCSSILE